MNGGSSSSASSPGPIPPRWIKCPRKSNELIGGKFLAIKTPLDKRYDDQVPLQYRYPVRFVFNCMKSTKAKIGLWIDLCNTSRFYDQKEVEALGAKYVKLKCKGRDETPNQDQVNTFTALCNAFIKKSPLEIIVVHCTHGFNRTGFMISCYYVEIEDWSVDCAVTTFANFRPPGIYKEDYITELFNRYGDVADAPAVPDLPDWCFDDDNEGLDDDGEQRAGSSDGGKRRHRKVKTEFMAGVDGVIPYSEEPNLTMLKKRITELCGWRKNGFPGSQPVSLDRKNIKLLSTMPYRVSWKADGTRYMMFIAGKDQIYFIDRDFALFKVQNMTFLHRKNSNAHLRQTLLDGEMVIDSASNVRYPRYLVYDIIQFEDDNVGMTNFNIRRLCIEKEIVGARNDYIKQGKIDKCKEPFSVRQKMFWDVNEARKLLGPKFMQELGHEPDGLIFQPVSSPYRPGQDEEVLKWKPSSLNSVDFKLQIVKETRPGMVNKEVGFLYVGGLNPPMAEIKVSKAIRHLHNKIIECHWDNAKSQWVFMRERTDKSFPNAYTTALNVCESIREPVTEEMLLDFIDNHSWKRPVVDNQLMPPPAKRPRC